MARTHGADTSEIGRGRHNDSSSSRESSPLQKRSFTPTSDDGDLVIPPIADDDTPPPPERPIIRQAVAFSSSLSTTPASINTYEASLPPAPTPYTAYFLPGQEVPLPKRKTATPKPRKAGALKRAKRADEPSFQTGRFRLQTYDPSPSAEPPLQHGRGPYSSMYRGTPSGSGTYSLQASPAPTPTSAYGDHFGGSAASPSPAPEHISGPSGRWQNFAPPNARSKPPKTRVKPSSSKPRASGSRTRTSDSNNNPTGQGGSFNQASSSSQLSRIPQVEVVGSAYYRHDYESDQRSSYAHEHASSSTQQSPRSDLPRPHTKMTLATPSNQRASPYTSATGQPTSEGIETDVKRIVRQLRMVTILIQDIRSGTTDNQLAEVKVSLKAADDPEDGFWTDAKELSEKLQAGPSRIDGPAKVYTLRGKYRQFFLRVSSENVNDCSSANLIVSPDRTLDVIVETLHPPGTLPLPPSIPPGMMSPSPEPDDPPAPRQTTSHSQANQHESVEHYRHGKRRLSSVSDDYDDGPDFISAVPHGTTYTSSDDLSTYNTPRSRSYQPGKRGPSKKRKSQDSMYSDESMHAQHIDSRRYNSPASDEEPENVQGLIVKAVDVLMQKDSGWKGFYKAKASRRLEDALTQYRFIKAMMDTWVGQAPFRSSQHIIGETHIMHALCIDDPKFAADCKETLEFLDFYGPLGRRGEDPRVIAVLNDQAPVAYNAKPIKRLLRLLREVHEDWNRVAGIGAAGVVTAARTMERGTEGPSSYKI